MSKDQDEHLAQLMAETERAERQRERLRLRAMDTVFPEDMSGWLDTLQKKRLPKELKELPDSLRKEFGDLIHGQIKAARRAIGEGDDLTLKENILIITDNLARMVENKAIHDAQRSSSDGKKGGGADKERVWAALVADKYVSCGTKDKIWECLSRDSSSSSPIYVDTDDADFEITVDAQFEVYVDGDSLCAKNTVTGECPHPIKRSTFEKYVTKAKKRRK